MATSPSDNDLQEATAELLAVLRDLEGAVEPPTPDRILRPPTPQGLLEFTSEVAIPGAILLLRTNIAALELLQRTVRMIDGNQAGESRSMQGRAASLTRTSLARLDTALSDLQTVIDADALDRNPTDVITEARRRTDELESQLAALEANSEDSLGGTPETKVDVEGELESLKQSVDDATDADQSDS